MKNVVEELGVIAAPSEWDPSKWDLTESIGKILQVNGAPLFDLVVQVDDRNTSRYVLSVTLPRQSGIVPQFHSAVPRDLLHVLDTVRSGGQRPDDVNQQHRRNKRQFINVGDSPLDTRDELPDPSFLDPLSHADPSLDLSLYLPDANFLQSIQV